MRDFSHLQPNTEAALLENQHIWKAFADLRQRKEELQWIKYDKSEQTG